MPNDAVREVLPLAGKRLELDGHHLRLGVPSAMALYPSRRLFARFVTLKHNVEPEPFLAKVREKLVELEIAGEPSIPLRLAGDHAGEQCRRVMRVHDATIVGFALLVDGLSDADSLKLQTLGLGVKTRMGAGFFVPVKGEDKL